MTNQCCHRDDANRHQKENLFIRSFCFILSIFAYHHEKKKKERENMNIDDNTYLFAQCLRIIID